MADHKLSATLKGAKQNDPWIVIYADTPAELQNTLIALQQGAVFAELGKAQAMFKTGAYQLGATLGAEHVDPQANPEPATEPAQQVASGGSVFAQPQEPAVPGAPVVLGQPAVLRNGTTSGRSWQAWADPRPLPELNKLAEEAGKDQLEYTDDNNHPGLAAGTHQYWSFFR